MKHTFQECIRHINNVLADLGQKKAYNIVHPFYNYNGYCLERIVAGTIALDLPDPEDVPAWDHWVKRYIPGEFFWRLWHWNMNNQGEPERELEDLLDDYLGLPLFGKPAGTVLGQVAALQKLKTNAP